MLNQNFLCPKCQQNKLFIESACDIEPDEYSDEARLQTIKCDSCDFVGIAIYQESHRGSTGENNFTHRGYFVAPDIFEITKNDINNKSIKNINVYTKNALSKFPMVLVDKPI